MQFNCVRPSHLEPLYAPTAAHARPVPTSKPRLASFSSAISSSHYTVHSTQQQTTTREISITPQHRPSATASDSLERGRYSRRAAIYTFGRSLRAHWQKKSDRLFAPVAFPSQVTDQGHNKLQQPHFTLPSAIQQRNTSPCIVTAPVARAAPAERIGSTAPHNNGFNTSTHLAPRAYTPRSYAWSFERQLRAILSTQIKARHSTKKSLRIFKL